MDRGKQMFAHQKFFNLVTLLVLSLFLTYSSWALAQVTTGTISGVVKDETEAVLPGVQVTITNVGTGASRALTTDEEGRYRAPQLPLGQYEVQAELAGFRTAIRSGITLTVGREAVVDITMTVGQITEKITVTGEAPLVETTKSEISALVDVKTIRDLPLNGRDLTQLVTLQVGTAEVKGTGGTDTMISGVGPGKRISVSGSRTSYNSYTVDAVDVQDVHRQAPSSVSSAALGVEAIREFSVLSNNYSAEYSSQGGAVVNAVTNSGTNAFHGSVFEFHRNSALDAKNFFDKAGAPIPTFIRNQFGFSVGGPVKKDQTFFFGSYEGLRERLGLSLVARLPDENARRGFLPDPANPGQLRNVGVDPLTAAYLAPLPLPNARNFGDGSAEFLSSFSRPLDEDYWIVRMDHRFSNLDSFYARYIDDKSSVRFPAFGHKTSFSTGELSWKTYAMSWDHVFSPQLINKATVGFNRTNEFIFTLRQFDLDRTFDLVQPCPLPTFDPCSFGNSADIDAAALTTIGGRSNHPKHYIVNNFQYADGLVYTRGRHSLKLGGLLKRFQVNNNAPQSLGGELDFLTLEDFLRARPFRFTGALPGASAVRSLRQWLVGLYIQDDFQMRPGLTWNLGLRYETASSPTENHGRLTNVRDELDPAPTVGEFYQNPSKWAFGPRIGFAWDLTGDQRTALRGGFGLFYQQLFSNVWFIDTVRQPPFFAIAVISNPAWRGTFLPQDLRTAGIPSLQSFDHDIDQPYIMQYNLTLQRQISPSTALTVGYAGSRGNHLLMVRSANAAFPTILPDGRKFFPPGAGRRNPNFSHDSRQSSWGQSFYNSLQVNLQRRFSEGLQFQAAYTFSRSIDDGYDRWDFPSGGGLVPGVSGFQDPDDHKMSRGLSSYHIQNNFNLNLTYDLPIGPGRRFGNDLTGAAGKILGGWQINGIATVADGTPFSAVLGYNAARDGVIVFTITPNLRPGASNNPALGGPDQYFDSTAFVEQELGFYGNLGRNTILGPGFANFDFALTKNTPIPSISEDFTIQFRAEFFNIFNRPQFSNPALPRVFFARGVANPAAGRITATRATSRQIQFGLKILF